MASNNPQEDPPAPGDEPKPVSLAQLQDAFARMSADDEDEDDHDEDTFEEQGLDEGTLSLAESNVADEAVISPSSVLEAMLFVGHPENEPLSADRAAELMRGVEPDDVRELVEELNLRYDDRNCPYVIAQEAKGYRLVLRESFDRMRRGFYGKVREAKLSQAAVDVLALVAYRQPITAEEVTSLRKATSGGILTQLLRRGLLVLERPSGHEKTRAKPVYRTSDRFLELFQIDGLEDLPRSQELKRP